MQIIFSTLIMLFFSQISYADDLILSLGVPFVLLNKGQTRVWIEDSKILQAEPATGKIILKGRKEGSTSLQVGQAHYKVQVLHPEKKETYGFLKKSLSHIVGLSPTISEGQIKVIGRLYQFQQWIDLADYVKDSSIQYVMNVKMNLSLQQFSQKYFNSLFEQAKIPPQAIVFEPTPEIRVSNDEVLMLKYQQILRPFGIQVVKDSNSLEIAPTIKVQITVAEVSHDFTLKYGIPWPSTFKATLLKSADLFKDSLELELQAMEGAGTGKILASPNLICRSGKEAEFLAGGEFPIKVMNYKTHDIIWKKYGIVLKVKPKADSTGRMSIAIETEVSRVDDSRKVDDVPAILTNRVSSHFDLTSPQTIALSGLIKEEEARQSQGLPGIANIPILGALFSSKNFKENKSELIIFVRPSILSETEEFQPQDHLGKIQASHI